MPVWLSLLGAVFGALGIFIALYGVLLVVTTKREPRAKIRIGISPGDRAGTLGFWASWNPEVETQFYRIRVTHWSPETKNKEGVFSVTFDPPPKGPFVQIVELPERFREVLEKESGLRRALFTMELKDTKNATTLKNFTLPKVQKVYKGKALSMPPLPNKLKPVVEDVPTVSTLDWSELVDRKKRMKKLEDEAKAKAAAKVAAAAAAAAKAAAPPPAAVAGAPGAPATPATPAAAKPAVPSAPAAKPVATAAPASAAPKTAEGIAVAPASGHTAASPPPKTAPQDQPVGAPKAGEVKPS
jgi:hypothetical protein